MNGRHCQQNFSSHQSACPSYRTALSKYSAHQIACQSPKTFGSQSTTTTFPNLRSSIRGQTLLRLRCHLLTLTTQLPHHNHMRTTSTLLNSSDMVTLAAPFSFFIHATVILSFIYDSLYYNEPSHIWIVTGWSGVLAFHSGSGGGIVDWPELN